MRTNAVNQAQSVSALKWRAAWICAVCLMALFVLFPAVEAQVPQVRVSKGWNFPLYEGTEVKALLTGDTADQRPGGVVELRRFRMITFRDNDTNKVEFVVEAPETLFHPGNKAAWSDGPLKVLSANTNYMIEGMGFHFQQTNLTLIVSNEVRTLLTSTNAAGDLNPPVHINADSFRFQSMETGEHRFSEALYEGNVHVIDPEMELTAGSLIIERAPGDERPRRIVAFDDVAILVKRDNSRVTGDQAVYTFEDGIELVTLSGNPVWRDETRESRADLFVIDRDQRTVRAEGNAYMLLPRAAFSEPRLGPGAGPEPAETPDEGADQTIEIFAATLTIELPQEKGPIRGMTADKDVRIVSRDGERRAFADHASYLEETRQLTLSGRAVWQQRYAELRAAEITLGGESQTLKAENNVHMRLRAGFSQSEPLKGDDTEQFIEIEADALNFESQVAVFEGNVRARLIEVDAVTGTLDSRLLAVHFNESNEIRRLVATDKVRLTREIERAASGAEPAVGFSRLLTCHELTTDRSPETRLLEAFHAEGDVFFEERDEFEDRTLLRAMTAGSVQMAFMEGTHRVKSMLAVGAVNVRRTETFSNGRKTFEAVQGERLVYPGSDGADQIEVTGNPVGQSGDALISRANVLIWNAETGRIHGRGPFRINPVDDTNRLGPLTKSDHAAYD